MILPEGRSRWCTADSVTVNALITTPIDPGQREAQLQQFELERVGGLPCPPPGLKRIWCSLISISQHFARIVQIAFGERCLIVIDNCHSLEFKLT